MSDLEKRSQEQPSWKKRYSSAKPVSTHLIAGLVVAILGVLFLIDNLHIVDSFSPMRYFMPTVFLSIGFALVIEHRSDRTWRWGIVWIVLGLWSFAYKSGWIGVSIWDLFWPFFLLAVGGYLIRRALTEGDNAPIDSTSESKSELDAPTDSTPNSPPPEETRRGARTVRGIGILSGSELRPNTQAMQNAELFALMGGVKLDLYDTQLVNDAATINVGACMGGIEILAPSEWTVVSNVLPFMGAFIDKRRPPAATTVGVAPKKTLTINGFVLMGGVEIKN